MKIMVHFALERDAKTIEVVCEEGATLMDVLNSARPELPQFSIEDAQYASFGLKLELNDVIDKTMRIEIVRPLIITPTEARRLRAQRGLADRNSLRTKRIQNSI